MTTLASLVAIVLIGILVAWLVGSLVLRAGGLLIVVAGLVTLATGGDLGVGIAALLLGTLAWLVGHWIYAFRHHEYRGPLARRVFLQALPDRADPTRRWGVPTASAENPLRRR